MSDWIDRLEETIRGTAPGRGSAIATIVHGNSAELLAALRAWRDQQWQPIETAPRDGTQIILACPHLGICGNGKFNADEYAKKPRPYWTHWGEHIFGRSVVRQDQPTHWMPQPPRPAPEGATSTTTPCDSRDRAPSGAGHPNGGALQGDQAVIDAYMKANAAPQPSATAGPGPMGETGEPPRPVESTTADAAPGPDAPMSKWSLTQIADALHTEINGLLEPTEEWEKMRYRRLVRVVSLARNRLWSYADTWQRDRELAEEAIEVLANLAALVRGECPSLLDEDSDGDGRLSIEIDEVLERARGKE